MKSLFDAGPRDGNLTERQQVAKSLLEQHPAGLTSGELGHAIHEDAGCAYCTPTRPCKYAPTTGQEVGKQLRKRDIAIQRKTGKWQLIRPPVTGIDPSTAPFPDGF